MNLLLQALLQAIEDLARAKGVRRFRVGCKRNAKGELVIALVVYDEDGPLGRACELE
ncbi:MAG: hypothetical protein IT373_16250 [Polyangiaceae bacterium]|nr:hypothetical protein [Polyangiaceae bacterium]